jgi:hypothetical protein
LLFLRDGRLVATKWRKDTGFWNYFYLFFVFGSFASFIRSSVIVSQLGLIIAASNILVFSFGGSIKRSSNTLVATLICAFAFLLGNFGLQMMQVRSCFDVLFDYNLQIPNLPLVSIFYLFFFLVDSVANVDSGSCDSTSTNLRSSPWNGHDGEGSTQGTTRSLFIVLVIKPIGAIDTIPNARDC